MSQHTIKPRVRKRTQLNQSGIAPCESHTHTQKRYSNTIVWVAPYFGRLWYKKYVRLPLLWAVGVLIHTVLLYRTHVYSKGC